MEGETGDDAGKVGTADSGDRANQLIKLILRGADDEREQAEGGLFGDGKETADPNDETDDDPEADGTEGAVFHAWVGV